MSEVKLNLVDANSILSGTIHGSLVDAVIAALSAEPETINELETALGRYIKPGETGEFASFRSCSEIDATPLDAGLVVIDLAARVIASESTYCDPGPEGALRYDDGKDSTALEIAYELSDDWRFVKSIEAYRWSASRRRSERQSVPPLDARAVLYGPPLIEFIYNAASELRAKPRIPTGDAARDEETLEREIAMIHANWLLTPRADLRGSSPREVMLKKQRLIELDMHSRCMQWSIQGEGPPCLSPDSFAYRFGGFGLHEWIVYYDMLRLLLWIAVVGKRAPDFGEVTVLPHIENEKPQRVLDAAVIDQMKSDWLESPTRRYDGRTPAIIIENERRRLPITMTAEQIMIDEDCECCRMMAMEAEMGFGPTFWHLDTSGMDEEFAFSTCLTKPEWEAEIREREEMYRKWDQERNEQLLTKPYEVDEFAS